MRFAGPRVRHLAFACSLAALILSCAESGPPTGPPGTDPPVVVRGAFAFSVVFNAESQLAALPINRVRVALVRAGAAIALDTVIDLPTGTVSATTTLTGNAAESFTLRLAMTNTAGDTIFRAGPETISISPLSTNPNPTPVALTARYSGVGSTATRIAIFADDADLRFDDTLTVTATAFENTTALANTPYLLTSSDTTRVRIIAGTNRIVARPVRGIANVIAMTLTGQRDTLRVNVRPVPRTAALVAGNNQSGTVNALLAQPLAVRVLAVDGLGVAGIPVRFATAAASGVVTDTLPLTDADGVARTTWRLGQVVGAMSATASVAAVTGSPIGFSATAAPGPLTSVAFSVSPPATSTAGVSLGTVTVRALDAFGNVATAFTDSLAITLVAPAGLTGTPVPALSGAARGKAVAGVVTFPALSVNRASSGYTLTARALSGAGAEVTGVSSGTSTAFAVTPAAAASLSLTQAPGAHVAGVTPSPSLTVSALDAFGNVVPSFTGTVSIALDANTAGATVAGTASVAAVAGVASFSAYNIQRAGTFVLRATATGLTEVATAPFAVAPGVATRIAITQAPTSVTAGVAFAPLLIVSALDAFDNVAAFPGAITIALDANPNGATLGGLATSAAAATPVTFNTLTLNRVGTGATLRATSGALVATTGTITVVPGAAAQLAFATHPSGLNWAGGISPAVQVSALDAVGNLVPSFTGSITLTGPAGTTLTDATATAVAGTAEFPYLRVLPLGTGYRLTATSGSLTSPPSNQFDWVSPAPGTVTREHNPVVAGVRNTIIADTLRVAVKDSDGNPLPGAAVTWTVLSATGGSFVGAELVTDANGKARARLQLPDSASTLTIRVASAAAPAIFTDFTVVAAPTGFTHAWTGLANEWDASAGAWVKLESGTGGFPSSASDSAFVSGGLAAYPSVVFGGPLTVGTLRMAPGTSASLSGRQLTIAGSLDAAGATLSDISTLALTGTAGSPTARIARGTVTAGAVQVTGAYGVGGRTLRVIGPLQISGSGRLAVGADSVRASSLALSGAQGRIVMGSGGRLVIDGNASFDGTPMGDTLITGGTLTVSGNVSVPTTGAFSVPGVVVLRMNGFGTQTITSSGTNGAGGAATHFGTIVVDNTAGVSMGSDLLVKHRVTLNGPLNFTPSGFTHELQLGDTSATSNTFIISAPNPAHLVSGRVAVVAGGAGVNILSLPTVLDAHLNIDAPGNPHFTLGFDEGSITTVSGHVILINGKLALGGHDLVASSHFRVLAGGALHMGAGDSLDVLHLINFEGGASVLTGGTIVVRGIMGVGNVMGAFNAGAAHTTVMVADVGSIHDIYWLATVDESSTPTGTIGPENGSAKQNHFGNLVIHSGAVTVPHGIQVIGGLTIRAGASLTQAATKTFGLNGTLIDETNGAGLNISGLRLNKTGGTVHLPATLAFQLPHLDSDPASGLVIAASVTLGNAQSATTTVSATGAHGARLAIVGGNLTTSTHALVVNGWMTKPNGQLTMTDAGALITVRDSLVVTGGQSLMTAGTIRVGGNFIHRGNNIGTFGPTATHQLVMNGAGARTLAFDPANGGSSTIRNLLIDGDASLVVSFSGGSIPVSNAVTVARGVLNIGTNTLSTGQLSTTNEGRLRMQNAGSLVFVNGNATFAGGGTNSDLTAGTLQVSGNFTQATNAAAFSATGTHTTVLQFFGTTRTVNFSHVDTTLADLVNTSHFANLRLSPLGAGAVLDFQSHIVASEKLSTNVDGAGGLMRVIRGNGKRLQVGGVDVDSISFENMRVGIADRAAFTRFNRITWTGMSASDIQLTLSRPGDGTPYVANFLTFDNPGGVPPNPGYHVFLPMSAGPGGFTLDVQNPIPLTGQRVLTLPPGPGAPFGTGSVLWNGVPM